MAKVPMTVPGKSIRSSSNVRRIVGVQDGLLDGRLDVGGCDGIPVVGVAEGRGDGWNVGISVGAPVGAWEGSEEGLPEGVAVGVVVGTPEGTEVGGAEYALNRAITSDDVTEWLYT